MIFNGLEGLSPEDQVLVSRFGRGPSVPVPTNNVHKAFEGIVDSHPTAVAARFEANVITYQELDVSANRLANYLIECGLRPGQRVCLVVQRSFEMLSGIFAILKAGCQYVPIDGGVASEHTLRHIFKDTGASFVLCLPQFEEKVRTHCSEETTIVPLGKDAEAFCSKQRPNIEVSGKDGVYAIYTSGSTGQPKGVDVMHANVCNALLLDPARLGITIGTKVAQVLNIAFDMGAWEILGCLMNGGTLYLRNSNWTDTLKEVDVFISTPSILSKYRRSSFPNIKTVVTGGEPCPQALADEWADGLLYLNICGPTEITILNSAHLHSPKKSLTIGKPLPNTSVYILDENMEPVPVGSKGSMWVGGAGVTRGYINLPDLTTKRYKADLFANDGSMMFNTGDIVAWNEDGSMNTFGRSDDQVKIKGFRVELDGVTAVIEKFPGITRACSTLIDGVLYGFYNTTTLIDEHDLDLFVRGYLPYYAVPSHWVYVAAIPLTPNGKVDKAKLAKTASRASKIVSSPRASKFDSRQLYNPAASPEQQQQQTDPEKGETILYSSNLSTFNTSATSIQEKPEKLPEKNGFRGQRWLRHRALIVYKKFFTVVVIGNVIAAAIILYWRVKNDRYMMADLATATAANLTMAILMRSEPVINLLFTIFCSVPVSWPLSIRRHCARIFHIGGIHSGCALAAIMWFLIFTIGAGLDFAKPPELQCISVASMVLTCFIILLLLAIASLSHPKIRAQYHDVWELTHRFGGWTALILLWIHAFLVTRDLQIGVAPSKAYLTSPPIWLLTVATSAIIFPWLFLRKVPVRSEVLSSHAVRLHFDYTTPVVGTSVRLAERPLVDWHGFATITNVNGKGFSLVVSNAGDFTKRTINRAPTSIWVRGIPACGVLRICTIFKSVVLVATGSGIGPCLAVVLAKKTPCRILWTAPNPEQTFGQEIVDAVRDTDPKAVIHNTRTQGKPDMNLMAYNLWKESGAEAVCVISNKKFTTSIVYAMEARGIPAYGAIFDS
ncbi:nonribosomal peptide synthetase 12 [Aaosphaeria arxii CBS 175.79]|uniref:Nonribosomal peptide synthetase 12 n=1 Tax=Aaosphaeria arxii CBS 175.79 TaxID=1450172 RepID=A0A6A5XSF6_9PLEO|nr:nonribosomal peptide synthetase 12 [Aaosphaeria arxii CBS 175.79]KAF2015836.1 nonribosomal peptide synthetase 12 [Aaosphaeria arxii CBS 175.79]